MGGAMGKASNKQQQHTTEGDTTPPRHEEHQQQPTSITTTTKEEDDDVISMNSSSSSNEQQQKQAKATPPPPPPMLVSRTPEGLRPRNISNLRRKLGFAPTRPLPLPLSSILPTLASGSATASASGSNNKGGSIASSAALSLTTLQHYHDLYSYPTASLQYALELANQHQAQQQQAAELHPKVTVTTNNNNNNIEEVVEEEEHTNQDTTTTLPVNNVRLYPSLVCSSSLTDDHHSLSHSLSHSILANTNTNSNAIISKKKKKKQTNNNNNNSSTAVALTPNSQEMCEYYHTQYDATTSSSVIRTPTGVKVKLLKLQQSCSVLTSTMLPGDDDDVDDDDVSNDNAASVPSISTPNLRSRRRSAVTATGAIVANSLQKKNIEETIDFDRDNDKHKHNDDDEEEEVEVEVEERSQQTCDDAVSDFDESFQSIDSAYSSVYEYSPNKKKNCNYKYGTGIAYTSFRSDVDVDVDLDVEDARNDVNTSYSSRRGLTLTSNAAQALSQYQNSTPTATATGAATINVASHSRQPCYDFEALEVPMACEELSHDKRNDVTTSAAKSEFSQQSDDPLSISSLTNQTYMYDSSSLSVNMNANANASSVSLSVSDHLKGKKKFVVEDKDESAKPSSRSPEKEQSSADDGGDDKDEDAQDNALLKRKRQNQRRGKELMVTGLIQRLQDNAEVYAAIEQIVDSSNVFSPSSIEADMAKATPENDLVVTGYDASDRNELLRNIDEILQEFQMEEHEHGGASQNCKQNRSIALLGYDSMMGSTSHGNIVQAFRFTHTIVKSAVKQEKCNEASRRSSDDNEYVANDDESRASKASVASVGNWNANFRDSDAPKYKAKGWLRSALGIQTTNSQAKERPTIASPESKSSSSTLSSNARIKLFELIGETLGDFVQFLRQLSIATKKLLLLDCNTAEEGVLAAEMIKQAYLGLMNLKTRHLLLLHDAFCLEEAEKSQCGDLESPFIPNANDHIIWKEAYNRLCAFSPEVVHLMDDSGIMDDGGDEGSWGVRSSLTSDPFGVVGKHHNKNQDAAVPVSICNILPPEEDNGAQVAVDVLEVELRKHKKVGSNNNFSVNESITSGLYSIEERSGEESDVGGALCDEDDGLSEGELEKEKTCHTFDSWMNHHEGILKDLQKVQDAQVVDVPTDEKRPPVALASSSLASHVSTGECETSVTPVTCNTSNFSPSTEEIKNRDFRTEFSLEKKRLSKYGTPPHSHAASAYSNVYSEMNEEGVQGDVVDDSSPTGSQFIDEDKKVESQIYKCPPESVALVDDIHRYFTVVGEQKLDCVDDLRCQSVSSAELASCSSNDRDDGSISESSFELSPSPDSKSYSIKMSEKREQWNTNNSQKNNGTVLRVEEKQKMSGIEKEVCSNNDEMQDSAYCE